jgi:hypothetical protein
MKRVLGVEIRPENNSIHVSTSEVEIQRRLQLFRQEILPSAKVKQWLLSGPGGKLYEIENTTICEVPNQFYCTISTDLNDISVASSVNFSSDTMNRNTFVEWVVSFWSSFQNGSMTRFASEIRATDDSFMKDCLTDFKAFIESQGSYPCRPLYNFPYEG